MDAIEKRAREILDFHVDGYWLEDQGRCVLVEEAVEAIMAALLPPLGYVLVPVEPTEAMLKAHAACGRDAFAVDEYAAMLAARPEVQP